MNCGEYIIHAAEVFGITHAFGIPGVHNLELYRGVTASGLHHVTPRHEQGAAFMADGFARVAGRPALVLPITGAGVLNAATAIAQAYSDSVPMLVVATNNPLATQGRGHGNLHETRDQRIAMSGILDDVFAVNATSELPGILRMALARLSGGRPRPVYIELPIDIAAAPMDASIDEAMPPSISVGIDIAPVAQLARLLQEAARPVILLGGGARSGAADIRQLVAQTGALVVSSVAGKGIVPDDAPCSLGARLGDDRARAMLEQGDLALAIGTELARPDRWGDMPKMTERLSRIDIDPAQLARGPRLEVAIQGNASDAVAALLREMKEGDRPCWADASSVAAAKKGAWVRWEEKSPQIARTLRRLRAALPDDAIVVTDMTQIAYAGAALYDSRCPTGWIHPVGYGTLGYGLPAAIGARLGAPDRTVVALAGDYGFGFSGSELATASGAGIGVPIIVWNNRRLGQIQDDMDKSDIPRVGVEVDPPDFEAFAKAHGAGYVDGNRTNTDLGMTISDTCAATKPMLIEIAEAA